MPANSNISELQTAIDTVWEERQGINPGTTGVIRDTVEATLELLGHGEIRVAEKGAQGWTVNQWIKKAVLLSFRLNDMTAISGAPGGATWWDKVPSKFAGMTPDDYRRAGFRAVPGAIVRRSAYIAPDVVLMPSFVNWVPTSTAAPWSTPGRPSALARRSARTATSPAAPASAACSSPCRPAPSSSRTTALLARAPRWPRA